MFYMVPMTVLFIAGAFNNRARGHPCGAFGGDFIVLMEMTCGVEKGR